MIDQIMHRQLELQRESFGIDPVNLSPADRASYVQAMALALHVEIDEALQEISWKPWASGVWFNREAFIVEMIDALHFWVNMILVATPSPSVVLDAYMNKAAINAQRQADGYTGEKCPTCGR